ncbi:uncharacterized protein SPSK_05769 [Sporothrix schenckii 1099-18]|uniref:Uncharacterized protein n=1 Tax=Sporothrix schenckii 1099-18 TaxID=1397361 RepID=A0A0F2LVQ8_SPOSC|nr:uncharacterized protein SPSK_05769 [Sporothrix schenckii 1099-18]KJR80580.1 hypothetical protein SPSK_05769 [Sporothrix schenckii 1099-18]
MRETNSNKAKQEHEYQVDRRGADGSEGETSVKKRQERKGAILFTMTIRPKQAKPKPKAPEMNRVGKEFPTYC